MHRVPEDLELDTAAAGRWPPLLVALRRTVRPDRSRVAAYVGFARSPGAWADYGGLLSRHGSWLGALDSILARWLPEAAGPAGPADEAAAAGIVEPPRTRAEAIGYLYVREAFRLGEQVLWRALGGSSQAAAAEPGAVAPARSSWRDLVRALRSVGPDEHGEVLAGARAAHAAWERRLAPSLERLGVLEELRGALEAS